MRVGSVEAKERYPVSGNTLLGINALLITLVQAKNLQNH